MRYLAHGARYGFFFTPDSLVMSLLPRDGTTGVNLWLDFAGARPDVSIAAAQEAPGVANYLRSGSQTGLPTFGEVVYQGLWPGVDMAINGRDGVLKYEFRVAPGTRVDDIRLAYRGSKSLATDAAGGLVVETAVGALRDSPPVSYQVIEGKRVEVASRYLLAGAQSYGFAVGGYDPAHELIIDPGLEYSTFLGGFGNQTGAAIAVDAAGNAVIGGATRSAGYPTTPGSLQPVHSGGDFIDLFEGFLTKLNPTGSALVYSTFLGGTKQDSIGEVILDAAALALDSAGNVYLTGSTRSADFPTTTGAFDRVYSGDSFIFGADAWVAKLAVGPGAAPSPSPSPPSGQPLPAPA